MADFTVFYGSQLYGEYTKRNLPPVRDFPNGCYMRNPFTNSWYVVLAGGWTPINLGDIPKEVKTICLLLGIPI